MFTGKILTKMAPHGLTFGVHEKCGLGLTTLVVTSLLLNSYY
jgi:hypothetical protein